MENLISVGLGMGAIALLWIMVWLARRGLPRQGCSIGWWDVDGRILLGIIFTMYIGLTATAPYFLPRIEGAMLVNGIWFGLTAWGALSLAVLGWMAKRWHWQRETVHGAFVLVPVFPCFILALFMAWHA